MNQFENSNRNSNTSFFLFLSPHILVSLSLLFLQTSCCCVSCCITHTPLAVLQLKFKSFQSIWQFNQQKKLLVLLAFSLKHLNHHRHHQLSSAQNLKVHNCCRHNCCCWNKNKTRILTEILLSTHPWLNSSRSKYIAANFRNQGFSGKRRWKKK